MQFKLALTLALALCSAVNAIADEDDSVKLASPEFNPIRTIHPNLPHRESVLADDESVKTAAATEALADKQEEVEQAAEEATQALKDRAPTKNDKKPSKKTPESKRESETAEKTKPIKDKPSDEDRSIESAGDEPKHDDQQDEADHDTESSVCDVVYGCDEQGGCDQYVVYRRKPLIDFSKFRNPFRRVRYVEYCDEPLCDVDGCDMLGERPRVFDGRLRSNIARTFRCGSPICDARGGCDMPGGCGRVFDGEMIQRFGGLGLRDRILGGEGPIRRYVRSRKCGSPDSDTMNGCDDGCAAYSREPKDYRFLVNPCRDARNPGALFRWRCQQCVDLPRLSDPLVTDRPDFTEASSVVGLRVTQVELGYTYIYDDRGPGSTKTNSYPEILVRRGLFSDWLELRIAWNYFSEEASDVKTDGSADLQLGFKMQLASQYGWLPELALITQATVPTGSDGFNSREVQPGMNLLYGWQLNDTWRLAGSTQFNRSSDDMTDESYYEWAQSVAVGCSVTERMGLYGEYFGLYPTSADTVEPQNIFNGGLTFLINNDVQWDIRAGTGLDSHSIDYFAGTGLSIRFR